VALTRNELNATGLEFLMTEVRTGLTFSEIALSGNDDLDKIQRNTWNARKAYDAILRFRDRVGMSKADSDALDSGMAQLRTNLLKLGETI
jgi:hypothetical protein